MAIKPQIISPAREAATPTLAPRPMPRLGEVVRVVVPEGGVLINNETGRLFAPGVPTVQIVTLTTLRRLADEDFALA